MQWFQHPLGADRRHNTRQELMVLALVDLVAPHVSHLEHGAEELVASHDTLPLCVRYPVILRMTNDTRVEGRDAQSHMVKIMPTMSGVGRVFVGGAVDGAVGRLGGIQGVRVGCRGYH